MDKGEYIKQQNKWIGFLKHKIGDKIPNAFGDGTIEVKDWNYMMNIVQLVQLHAQFFFKPIRALSPLSELISKVIGQYQIRIGKAFLDMEVRNYELVKNEVEIEPGIAGNQKAFSYLVDSLLRFYKAFLEEKRKQLINQPEVKSGILEILAQQKGLEIFEQGKDAYTKNFVDQIPTIVEQRVQERLKGGSYQKR